MPCGSGCSGIIQQCLLRREDLAGTFRQSVFRRRIWQGSLSALMGGLCSRRRGFRSGPRPGRITAVPARRCRAESRDDPCRLCGAVGPRQLSGPLDVLQPLQHLVDAGQAVTDRLWIQHPPPGARRAEQVFSGVHGALHGRELHDAGAALERVQVAEHAVQLLRILWRTFQREQ